MCIEIWIAWKPNNSAEICVAVCRTWIFIFNRCIISGSWDYFTGYFIMVGLGIDVKLSVWFIWLDYIFSAVLCGTPPAVENAHLIGRRRSHYDIHAVVRYQCSEGFFQRHIPTARCRADGSWERPRIICTKCECSMSILNSCHVSC